MEQVPSREANRSSASKEIPRILWNAEIHYRIHISPPSVTIKRQVNPFGVLQIYFFKILPSTRRFSKCPVSLSFHIKITLISVRWQQHGRPGVKWPDDTELLVMECSGSALNVRNIIFSNLVEPGYDAMKEAEYLVSLQTGVVSAV